MDESHLEGANHLSGLQFRHGSQLWLMISPVSSLAEPAATALLLRPTIQLLASCWVRERR